MKSTEAITKEITDKLWENYFIYGDDAKDIGEHIKVILDKELRELALRVIPMELCLTFCGDPEQYISAAFTNLQMQLNKEREFSNKLLKEIWKV